MSTTMHATNERLIEVWGALIAAGRQVIKEKQVMGTTWVASYSPTIKAATS